MPATPSTPVPQSNFASAILLGVFAVAAFGATLPVTHIALEAFSPAFLTCARALIATLIAVITLRLFKRSLLGKNNTEVFISGFLLIFAFPGLMAIAMQTVPAAHGGVVLGFLPLATAVIARMIASETPSTAFWIWSVMGGMIVTGFIFARTGFSVSSTNVAGYGWLVLAGLSAACGYVIFGKLSRSTPGWVVISRALVINTPVSIAGFYWVFGEVTVSPGIPQLAALFYLGSVSMFAAFCAWNAALAIGGIARIGQLQLLQIFFTIAVSAWLLGEKIDLLTIVAAIAVTLVIAASRRS